MKKIVQLRDSAKSSIAGYLFQFEKALFELACLTSSDQFITIEEVDDVATHSSEGAVLVTTQAKHSISGSGSSFGSTSAALWRTIEIWITKIKAGTFDTNTTFICCSNVSVSDSSILNEFLNSNFLDLVKSLTALKKEQNRKLKEIKRKDPKDGTSIAANIKLLSFALKNLKELEIIQQGIRLNVVVDIKKNFMNAIHANSDSTTDISRDRIYDTFYGWILSRSVAMWRNSTVAKFSKADFDNKYLQITSNPGIINAVFRTKELLGEIPSQDVSARMKDLFVIQIQDIKRNQKAKERIIKDAILDFIYADLELGYVITKGNYTQEDFDKFLEECCRIWQSKYDEFVLKEVEEYTAEELNELAIGLYDFIILKLEMKNFGGLLFCPHTDYLRRGSFLKLSNIPRIGWHPEWEIRYKI